MNLRKPVAQHAISPCDAHTFEACVGQHGRSQLSASRDGCAAALPNSGQRRINLLSRRGDSPLPPNGVKRRTVLTIDVDSRLRNEPRSPREAMDTPPSSTPLRTTSLTACFRRLSLPLFPSLFLSFFFALLLPCSVRRLFDTVADKQ